MKTLWFQHIKEKEKQEEFKKSVIGSKIVLDKLKEVCYTLSKNGERSSLSDYDSPSWALRQADKIGYARALKEIIEILTIDSE